MNIQDWFLLGLTSWISLQPKGLSRVFSNTTVQKHQFLGAQLSLLLHPYMTTEKTIALTRQNFVGKVMSLLFNMLSAAAKSLQSCLTLCDPRDGSPTGSAIPGILQARTLEWVAISFSNAWKWKVNEVAQSYLTLSNPMDCSPPGSSIHGIFQTRVLEWGAISFSAWSSRKSQNNLERRARLSTTKSKPSAIVQHASCFCYKLPLIREVILWRVTCEKWKIYRNSQSFFTCPPGWPTKSTDLRISQLDLKCSFQLKAVVVTVVQSNSHKEPLSAG